MRYCSLAFSFKGHTYVWLSVDSLISKNIFYKCLCLTRGWDSIVGLATCYRLDGLGLESQWGARLSTNIQTGPVAHPASYTMGTGSFPGVKQPWRGDHPPPSSAEVKERVEGFLHQKQIYPHMEHKLWAHVFESRRWVCTNNPSVATVQLQALVLFKEHEIQVLRQVWDEWWCILQEIISVSYILHRGALIMQQF